MVAAAAIGDTSYRDQLDDDLMDFVKAVGLDQGIQKTLIGFSSGGGFVLRTASGANRQIFDAYLAISPYIAPDSPTTRPASGGWASVAVPRVVALTILDGFGALVQGLPVVRFATASGPSKIAHRPIPSGARRRPSAGPRLAARNRADRPADDRRRRRKRRTVRAEQYAPLLKG